MKVPVSLAHSTHGHLATMMYMCLHIFIPPRREECGYNELTSSAQINGGCQSPTYQQARHPLSDE
jgi:hypothetical protein